MATVLIRGQEYEIDVTEEIERFDWDGARWSPDKLIARSPFRIDHSPSFFVTLEGEFAGAWGDSGSVDEYFASGGFVKLIALLEGREQDEIADEMIEKYGYSKEFTDVLHVPHVELKERPKKIILSELLLDSYEEGSDYLLGRGIDVEAQTVFGARTDTVRKALVIPWRSVDGRLAAIKYRKEEDKQFWYKTGGVKVSDLVYGLDIIHSIYDETKEGQEVVICESEIDAMSWRQCGRLAIAIGGSHMSKKQAGDIHRSPISRLIMSLDRDEPGRKLGRQIVREFGNVSYINLPKGFNDANDVLKEGYDLSELVIEDYFDNIFN